MATQDDAVPGVSYVMPVLNERDYIEGAIEAVLSQDYAGAHDLVLALGPSTDGTNEIVEKLAAADARITFVHNPNTDIPVGLNLAIASSSHPIVVRIDAHSELAAGYTTRAVETLHRTGAATWAASCTPVVRRRSSLPSHAPTTADSASGERAITRGAPRAPRSRPISECSAERSSWKSADTTSRFDAARTGN